ncbi:MAG: alpha/beta fold hydrolase [Crocinitomix sp.]|nr:alpha/beta fold hydrolase [Crocinitomix sp.]
MSIINQQIILKDGRKLGFAEYGNLKGYPIVYCHGSQSSRLEMHYDMSFAIENDLRIITIDRPGHGISDFNPDGTILDFAKDVKQLTEHLKIESFSAAGMSAGSPFALGIAYLFPRNVRKTAIISGFAPYDDQSKKHLSKEVKIMLNLARRFPFLLRLMLRIQAKQLSKNPKKALKGFLKIMSEPDQEILQNDAVMGIIEQMFTEAFRNGSEGVAYEISRLLVRDWEFNLNKIQVPIAFWQGEKDNNVPHKWAELMRNEIPNATLKLFPEEGHLIIFEHAEEIFTDLKD